MIIKAASFAAEAHKNQKRKYSGEPYINHCLRVAHTLEELQFPVETVSAALLHDTVEDCDVTEADIRKEFGDEITRIVMGVTNPSKPEDGNRKTRKAIDRDHLAKGDYHIHSLKCADMVDNLRSILEEDKNFAVVYVREKKLLLPLLVFGSGVLRNRVQEILDNADKMLQNPQA